MLRFILGKSGTGKTKYIYDSIREKVSEGEKDIVLLVPDQSTFENEKALLSVLGAESFGRIKVFGFESLCRYAFEQAAVRFDNVIDSGTRAVIMSLAIEQLSESLTLLNTKNNKSVTELMLHTLTESKKSGISSEQLRLVSDRVEDETLRLKLLETSLIFDAYEAYLSQSYIDPLDDLDRLYEVLLDAPGLFEGATLFIDSFSGFTAQQRRVLTLLMERCASFSVSLCLDPSSSFSDSSCDAFATTRDTFLKLGRLANDLGVPVADPITFETAERFKLNPDLSELEKRVFRVKNCPSPCDYAPRGISVFEAGDAHNECEYAAQEIKRLIIEEGFLYSDISVICHNTDDYKGIIDTVFEKYEIPYFIDDRRDVEVMPLIRLLNAVFRLVLDNFEREDVLLLLKSGLTPNTQDEISIFENYILTWNINNSAFKTPFTQNPRGFSRTLNPDDAIALNIAEGVRRSVVDPLLSFREGARNKNGREISAELYKLLNELTVPEALKKLYCAYEKTPEREKGSEQIKLWRLVMEALDKLVAASGERPLSLKRYYELLQFQLSSIELSQIPRTIDSVSVTTAQRLRSSGGKAAFLIGCAEGVFPASPEIGGLFSAFELQVLAHNDLKITDGTSDLVDLEKFMAYTCLTSPTERLYLSYHAQDLSGNQYLPSEIIGEVRRKAFPKVKCFSPSDYSGSYERYMFAEAPAFEQFAASLAPDRSELPTLREFFESNSEYSAKNAAVLRAGKKTPFAIENKENAELLFGKELNISASQLKTFYQCPFSYFCHYGLRVRERKEAKIDPLEIGNLVHEVLEKFFTAFTKPEYKSMSEESVRAFIADTVSRYLESYFGGADQKDEGFIFELEMIKNNVFIVLRHIIDELSQSDFDVLKCEMSIPGDIGKHTISLSNGNTISIIGKVDRADIMSSGGEQYLRVIDYKTGPMDFHIGDIVHGINMQMLIYLRTVLREGAEKYGAMQGAGILYAPAQIETVSDKELSDEALTGEIRKKLKMNGLVLDDPRVILGMDKTDNKTFIPVAVKPNRDANYRITGEELTKVFEHVDRCVEQMGRRIFDGRIEADPLKGFLDGCEHCRLDSVCAFGRSDGRNAASPGKAETLEIIDRELENDDMKGGEDDAVDAESN